MKQPRKPKRHPKNGAGKGSVPRPVDKAKYDENYERIFGKKEDKNGKS